MLDVNLQLQLKIYLECVICLIQIIVYVDDGVKLQEMLDLLQILESLLDKIMLQVLCDGQGCVLFFDLGMLGQDIYLIFVGLLMGYEFILLVLVLLQVGGYLFKVIVELIEQVQNLEGEYRFEIYFLLLCQNCLDVVQVLNLVVVFNLCIQYVVIDGVLFQDEVEKCEIMLVLIVYFNGEVFDQGCMILEQIVVKLDINVGRCDVEKIVVKDVFDVLVVGGGLVGVVVVIYVVCKGICIGIVVECFGGQVLDMMVIENFILVKEIEGLKLVMVLEQYVCEYDVDIMNLQCVSVLVLVGEDGLVQVQLENGVVLKLCLVILFIGVCWWQMNVLGEDQYCNKGVVYCLYCDGLLFKGKCVVVIGGGNFGVEVVIDLVGIVLYVILLEFDFSLCVDEVLQKKLCSLGNVIVLISVQIIEVFGDGSKVIGLVYKDCIGGDVYCVELEGIFVQIGLLFNIEWLKDVVVLLLCGEIVIDDCGQINLLGVFVVGDCMMVFYKQIIIVMGVGFIVVLSVFDYLICLLVSNSSGVVVEVV